MNRFSLTTMVLVLVLDFGCSSESERSKTPSFSDISKRKSERFIVEDPSINDEEQNSSASIPFQLTDTEKEIFRKSVEQVNSVVKISMGIIDTNSAIQSIEKLREARRSLQSTRADFRNKVSNSQRRFRMFATDEGKLLQQAMWKMKNELHRLELNNEIQVILTDGMGNKIDHIVKSNSAEEERKKFKVTASNVSTLNNLPVGESSDSKGTLAVSAEPLP